MSAQVEPESFRYASPFGEVRLCVRGGMLTAVHLGGAGVAGSGPAPCDAALEFVQALDRYFAGQEPGIDADALDLSGATEFQRRVYRELLEVSFGETVTYGELARRSGVGGGARAVGQAVGRNPLPIFVPCHRVVAAGGRLGGFGAGLRWKRSLLSHEGWAVREDKIVSETTSDNAPRVCVYAGSFDPPTMGHIFMIEKGAALFDRLIVAVGDNPQKRCTFSTAERIEMLLACVEDLDNAEVDSFRNQFLVHYARGRGAGYVLRGIRTDEDYRFEHAMRNVNEDLEPGITTVFLISPREVREISSSFVKGLVGVEGWQDAIRAYVPEPVYEKLLSAEARLQWGGAIAEGPEQ